MKVCVIIPAAGSGSRTGLYHNKVLSRMGALPMLTHTLMPFVTSSLINKIIVVHSVKDTEAINGIISSLQTDKSIIAVQGGDTRTQSVANALPYAADSDITLIHDAARPFVSQLIIEQVITAASIHGAAIPAIPLIDTVKKVIDGKVAETIKREQYVSVQTPQGFKTDKLIKAYSKANGSYSDDSAVYEQYIGSVAVVEGSPDNIKITTPEDFNRYFPKGFKVGTGYDVHPLVENRRLVLGGVEIPHYKGLMGHSDADCLTHAIMDAILTAAGLRDIGNLFPDTDKQYLNINSLILLKKVYNIIISKGYKVNNISAEIIAEKPKLMKFIPLMQGEIANVLNINSSNISIAATTSEGLGITGSESAIAAYAVVSLIEERINE